MLENQLAPHTAWLLVRIFASVLGSAIGSADAWQHGKGAVICSHKHMQILSCFRTAAEKASVESQRHHADHSEVRSGLSGHLDAYRAAHTLSSAGY